jgi:hypothetical protein
MSQISIVQFANGQFGVRKENHIRNFEYMESKINGVRVRANNKGGESAYQVNTLTEVTNESFDYGTPV